MIYAKNKGTAEKPIWHIVPSNDETTIGLLVAAGYSEVTDRRTKVTRVPYGMPIPKIIEEDGRLYMDWAIRPIPLCLNRDKVMTVLKTEGLYDGFVAACTNDPAIVQWWIEKAVYLDGSPMAIYIAQKLNLSQDDLRALIVKCV